MNLLMQVLFWCPKCWRSIGYWMFTLCGAMLLLGWRLSNRTDRIESRTGVVVDLDTILAAIPLPIPASVGGFALTMFGAVLGLFLGKAGKWAQRL